MSRIATLVLLAATSMLFAAPPAAHAQGCPAISPFDSTPDDAGLQCLLDAGGTIALSPGSPGYLLAGGLRIAVDNTHLTSTTPGQYARLVAAPSLRGMMLRMRGDVPRNNYSLSFLTFDGNKFNRLGNYAADCSTDYRPNGISVSLKGAGFSVHDVNFENTMCGSSLEVSGSGYNVYNNTIANAGFSEGSGAAAGTQPYSDGITLLQCINASVTNNRVFEATDVGIVVGLSTTQSCAVSRNLVRNNNTYAFAGITTGGPTAHTGSYVSDNTVEASHNLLSFGMYVGEGPWAWSTPTPDAGLVSGNVISGAVVNLAVDNIGAGVVRDNILYGARGTRGMLGCTWPAELTYGTIGGAAVQPGGVYRTWNGGCNPYLNAPPSARITGPANGSVFLTNQSITVTATASDPDTTASQVSFYAGSTLLFTDTTAPFSYTAAAPLPVGTFDLTAVASDAAGRGPTSNVVRVTVNQAPVAPTVTITSPGNGAVLPAGSMLSLTASTTGTISSVDFYAFITATQSWLYLGRDTTAPYALTVGPIQYGDYPIAAVANGTVVSPLVTVYVR